MRPWLLLVLQVFIMSGESWAHTLEAPAILVADQDGGFAYAANFVAGPQGAVLLELVASLSQESGLLSSDILFYACGINLGPGESITYSPPQEFFSLSDPAKPGIVRITYDTRCPGAPEQTILEARTVILPAICGQSTTLCLHDGRFIIEVDYQDFAGHGGSAKVADISSSISGTFWFFGPENLELLVKVIDGCALNGHYWAFISGATNLMYLARIMDTATGEFREYRNDLGSAPVAVVDTTAFPYCP